MDAIGHICYYWFRYSSLYIFSPYFKKAHYSFIQQFEFIFVNNLFFSEEKQSFGGGYFRLVIQEDFSEKMTCQLTWEELPHTHTDTRRHTQTHIQAWLWG